MTPPLNDESGSISTESSFENTLAAVCEAAVKLVKVDHSGLVLFDHNYENATVRAEYPSSVESAVGKQFRIRGVPLEEQLVHSRQPIVVQDVASEESLGVVQNVLLEMGIRSIVVVPIIVDGEVKGSFSFDALNEVRQFNKADEDKCASLAEFASVVVKNVYLLKNLEALRKAMLAISSVPERQPLLEAITREAVNLLQVEGGGIDELDERNGDLTIVAQFNMPEEIVGKTMQVGEGLAGRIIEQKLDYMTEPNYSEWEGRAPYFWDNKILQSLIGVPLHLNQQPTGVLWLNDARPRVFTEAEIELLKGLAAPASIALEQTALRDLETSKAIRLQALARSTNDIFVKLSTSRRKERLTLIAKYAHEIIDAELCGIFLVEEPGWITLVAGHGYKEGGFKEGLPLKMISGTGTGLTGHIAKIGEVVRLCGDELRKHPASTNRTGGADYSESGECFSILAIPLKGRDGELKGLISVNNKNDKDGKPNEWTCFTNDDQAIGEIFAQAAIVAIETADLLDEIKRGQEHYKTVLEASNVLALAKVPEDGLGALAEMVLGVINKSFCRILFYDERENGLQVVAAEKAKGKKGAFKWNQRLGEKAKVEDWKDLDQCLHSGQFQVLKCGDPEAETTLIQLSKLIELRNDQDYPLQMNYLFRTPFKVDDRIIGLLLIGELDRKGDFTPEELDQAQAIANQASLLIERLQRDKKLLHDLFETERAISASTDAHMALRLVAEQVYEVGRAFGRKVNVVDINVRDGGKLRVVAAHPPEQLELIRGIVGDPFDMATGFGKERRLGLVGRVIRDGHAVNESDVRTNSDYVEIHPDTLSQLVVPITDGIEVLGAISVESSEIGAFDNQDRTIVEGLASQASSAISKEKQSREHKKVRAIALFGAAERGLRHVLMPTAKFVMELAREALTLSDIDAIRKKLTTILDNATSIYNFPFTAGDQGISEVFLNVAIKERVDKLRDILRRQKVLADIKVDLSASIGCRVAVNNTWFQQYALLALFSNAREAIARASPKLIEVYTEMTDDSHCRIVVKNTGPKISDEVWEMLGNEPIGRADGDRERGRGLLIADFALALYGGKLEKIENNENSIVIGISLPMSV